MAQCNETYQMKGAATISYRQLDSWLPFLQERIGWETKVSWKSSAARGCPLREVSALSPQEALGCPTEELPVPQPSLLLHFWVPVKRLVTAQRLSAGCRGAS